MRSQDESESFFDHRFLWVFLAGLWRQGGRPSRHSFTVSRKKGGGWGISGSGAPALPLAAGGSWAGRVGSHQPIVREVGLIPGKSGRKFFWLAELWPQRFWPVRKSLSARREAEALRSDDPSVNSLRREGDLAEAGLVAGGRLVLAGDGEGEGVLAGSEQDAAVV